MEFYRVQKKRTRWYVIDESYSVVSVPLNEALARELCDTLNAGRIALKSKGYHSACKSLFIIDGQIVAPIGGEQ